MTTPPPPSDTDRIIAAQREESRKTRVLLLWIFVGIPVVAAVLWGAVVGLTALSRNSQPSGTDTSGTVDTTVSASATVSLLGVIHDDTSCAMVNAGATDDALNLYTGGYFDGVRQGFQNECNDNPGWPASRALAQAKRDTIAPTP